MNEEFVIVRGDAAAPGTITAKVDNSRISAPSNTIANQSPATCTVRAANSRLAGGPVYGTVKCGLVIDENFDSCLNTCPP